MSRRSGTSATKTGRYPRCAARADDALLVDTTGLSLEEGYLKLRRVIDECLEGVAMWRKNRVLYCKAGSDFQPCQGASQRRLPEGAVSSARITRRIVTRSVSQWLLGAASTCTI